ncbi:hypothetical protein U3516DRAFT_769900 [Neocallimastix sp. 'constans']
MDRIHLVNFLLSFANLASLRIDEHVFDHVERSNPYVVQLARLFDGICMPNICILLFKTGFDAKTIPKNTCKIHQFKHFQT